MRKGRTMKLVTNTQMTLDGVVLRMISFNLADRG
jgi:hypothetical protein